MIVLWMMYSVLVSVLLAVAAHALDGVLRFRSVPVRWVWACALVALVFLTAVAPLRGRDGSAAADLSISPGVVNEPVALSVEGAVRVASEGSLIAAIRAMLNLPLGAAGVVVGSWPGRRVEAAAGIAWVSLSIMVGLVYAFTLVRFHRARNRWPRRRVHGAPVRVAPDAGPAVAGFMRPEIVVPRWLLARGEDDVRLAIEHEREHLRVHDPALLLVGGALAAILAWNPAVWWMLARLRLAVELDCDARLLRRGVRPQRYGSFLLEIAGYREKTWRIAGALTLIGARRHLERRLIAMTSSRVRIGPVRAAATVGIGGGLILAACGTEMPTAADIEQMDVGVAQASAARVLGHVPAAGEVTYVVDGAITTSEVAERLDASEIEAIEVVRGPDTTGELEVEPAAGVIRVTTVQASARGQRDSSPARVEAARTTLTPISQGPPAELDAIVASRQQGGPVAESEPTGTVGQGRVAATDTLSQPLIVVDGVVMGRAQGLFGIEALDSLDREEIESIEVIKGPAARALYGSRGAAGVIQITTKDAESTTAPDL